MATLSNIKRQLVDIINEGNKFNDLAHVNVESVFHINKYAQELKTFLEEHTTAQMINERLARIKPIHFESEKFSFWFALTSLFLGAGYLYYSLKEYNNKKQAQSEILEMISVFSSIEFLLRNQE